MFPDDYIEDQYEKAVEIYERNQKRLAELDEALENQNVEKVCFTQYSLAAMNWPLVSLNVINNTFSSF